jgi:cytochrome P450
MERCRARFGDAFTLRLSGDQTFVFLSDPEDVKTAFTGDPRMLRAGEANLILRPVVGSRSVLLLDEPEHMVDRKLMLPPFHGERMQRYGEIMVQAAREEIARWPSGRPLALWPRMQAITLEVIVRAVFGLDERGRMDELEDRLRRMLDWLAKPSRLTGLVMGGPDRVERNTLFRRATEPVDELLLAEIARRRESPDLAERDDILSMLVQARYEDGSAMSDRDLRDELVTLLVAGHETTATSLAWALERLVRHPEALARATEEARAGEGEYIDAIVKETLRLRPVLPIVVRMLGEPMAFAGRTLPAGTPVAPCIYLMHRREDVYPQAGRFRPERFLEQSPGTYTWIPFGGGVRRCLGASFATFEMRQVLQTILAEVELSAAERASETMTRRGITFTPAGQATAVIHRRSAAAQAPPDGTAQQELLSSASG